MKNVVLITGGSRGIGAATARLAARQGYTVAINYRSNVAAAEKVLSEITAGGGEAKIYAADIGLESEVEQLFSDIDADYGPLSALVNNTGILEQHMPLSQMSAARLERVFTTNITGSFLCAREAVRRMSTARGGDGGAIVNVSSAASRLGSPNEYVDYAASKAAIDTFTIGLAKEVAAEGIRVNAVRPGVVYTDIHASGGEPERVERVRLQVPMQRGGQPAEVANAILWLLSDEASYSTGSILDVAGGR